MKLLGVKIGDHDSNLSYYDGHKVYYHKSERYHQLKHLGLTDLYYWVDVIAKWGVDVSDLDAICLSIDPELIPNFHFDPTKTFEQIPNSIFENIHCPIFRLDHHLSHALSIWPIADFDKLKYHFVFDGDGDFNRSYTIFKGYDILETKSTDECESFGKVLEDLATLNAIKGHVLDLSGKAMGLKSYGKVNKSYLELFDDGEITDLKYVFDPNLWSAISADNNPLDFLATIHAFAENKFVEFFSKFVSTYDFFSYSGGVAQNSVINGKLQAVFPNMVIPPHSTDDGLSLGCLEFLRRHYNLEPMSAEGFPYWQDDPEPDPPSINTILKISEALSDKKIVGWFQGRGEIGPRALGNRSILLDPRIINGKEIINSKVKQREWYRPFGCSILKGFEQEYFENVTYTSPYMLHVAKMKNASNYPSISHVDSTVRFQSVDESSPYFYQLLLEFYNRTGCPFLLNTSLNVNKFPIASKPEDAIKVFQTTDIDILCIGDMILKK